MAVTWNLVEFTKESCHIKHLSNKNLKMIINRKMFKNVYDCDDVTDGVFCQLKLLYRNA